MFTINYALPISPRYPGLEELTSALAQTTRLSLFTSGLIVPSVAHLLFVILLFLIFRAVTRSHRLAGVAIVIYFSTPDLSSFDSMYVYQTLALSFMALALLQAWRATDVGGTYSNVALAVFATAATAVTRHATSYVLAAVLLLLTASCSSAPPRACIHPGYPDFYSDRSYSILGLLRCSGHNQLLHAHRPRN